MTRLENMVSRFGILPGSITHVPEPHYTISEEGRMVVSVGDFKISGIFDTDKFAESIEQFPRWLSPHEHDIASRFEESTMHEFRDLGPRIYSGMPAYSHIVRDAVEAMKISGNSKIPLDFIILIAIIGHDRIEDDKEVKRLEGEWRQAALSGDNALRINKAKELSSAREAKKDAIRAELLQYVPTKISGLERTKIYGQINEAVSIIYGLTRFFDENPYAFSVGDQYTVMKDLNIKIDPNRHPNEHPNTTFRRMIAKDADIISNIHERGLLVEPNIMRGVVAAFARRDEMGQTARDLYGPVVYPKESMPQVVQVKIAFQSMYPLHYGNETFNALAPQIFGVLGESRTADLMRLAMRSHREMGLATLALRDSATRSYEQLRHIRGIKPRVEREVESMKGTRFYDSIDITGPAVDWLLRDPLSKAYLKKLDSYKIFREENYRALMLYRMTIERLLVPDGFNPASPLPTMDGMDALRILSGQYYQRVQDYKRRLDSAFGARGTNIGMLSL